MKCEEVSKELVGYLGKDANSAQQREIEDHLAGCAACRKRAEEFRGIWSVLDEVPAVEPSFGFDARVRQRIAAEPRRRWLQWAVLQPRLAFAALLLIVLTVWVAKPPAKDPGATATVAAKQQEDFNAIKNLGVLENYDVVTKMDALSELTPAATPQPDQHGTQSND